MSLVACVVNTIPLEHNSALILLIHIHANTVILQLEQMLASNTKIIYP